MATRYVIEQYIWLTGKTKGWAEIIRTETDNNITAFEQLDILEAEGRKVRLVEHTKKIIAPAQPPEGTVY